MSGRLTLEEPGLQLYFSLPQEIVTGPEMLMRAWEVSFTVMEALTEMPRTLTEPE
jgi:hypothetical protein